MSVCHCGTSTFTSDTVQAGQVAASSLFSELSMMAVAGAAFEVIAMALNGWPLCWATA
jgi:hypothetical protein